MSEPRITIKIFTAHLREPGKQMTSNDDYARGADNALRAVIETISESEWLSTKGNILLFLVRFREVHADGFQFVPREKSYQTPETEGKTS